MNETPARAEGIESVALGLAVAASLAGLAVLAALYKTDVLPAAALAVAGLLLAGLSRGLFRRRRWAWRTAFAVSTVLTLLVAAAGVLLAVELATHGFGRPHGVTAGGEGCLCVLLPVLLLVGGLPLPLLWKDRSRV